MRNGEYTYHEIIENYGPIMASDQDYGVAVSVNGSYFQIWQNIGSPGIYKVVEAYDFASRIESKDGLYQADMAKVLDKAREILREYVDMEDNA